MVRICTLDPGWLDRFERGPVRPGVPATHDEGHCDAVLAVDNLKHLDSEAREGFVQGAGPSGEISQRHICAVDAYGIGIQSRESIFHLR
jgi:hypothetical protein